MKKLILIYSLLIGLAWGQEYDPETGEIIERQEVKTAEASNDPCIQATIDAQNDVNGALWYGAGCLFPILGLGASYVIEPNPNAFKLVGKTSDYVSVYTGCYRIEGKKIQQKKARNGCLTYVAAYLSFVRLITASADPAY